MKILFLTIARIKDVNSRGIYNDLMRKFHDEGHEVYIASPNERRFNLSTSLTETDGVHRLGIWTFNIQKTNVLEKGIGTLMLERQFEKAIMKYWGNIKFDLVLYSTPPITFPNVIASQKKKNLQVKTYLLLKDIFPQNAVDLGMFSKSSLFYKYFRRKEEKLYRLSDHIGCMSPANVRFVLDNNPEINNERVELAPNSVELPANVQAVDRGTIRRKYGLPQDKPVFIYGGNIGKPQGIDYLVKCLEANKSRTDCHFLVIGDGTEYPKIEEWYKACKPQCCSLFKRLPKEDYDYLVQACDVGLIFLDHRFTIPNYPSRLLSYLEYKMPILAATDVNTDIGTLAVEHGYGYCCESVKPEDFTALVDAYINDPASIKRMGENGYKFLLDNYLVSNTYNAIIKHL